MSNLLRSLSTNEQIERIARFFERIAHFSLSLTKNEQFAQKNSNKLYFVCFLHFCKFSKKKQKICTFPLSDVSRSLRSLRGNEQL